MNQVTVMTKTKVKRDQIGGAIHAHLVSVHEQLFYSGNRFYSVPVEDSKLLVAGLVTAVNDPDESGMVDITITSRLKSETILEHAIGKNEHIKIVESI